MVLDTNIVLDVFVFDDPATQDLKEALRAGKISWLATLAMRDELVRVLTYATILKRLTVCQLGAQQVLAQFDALAALVDAPTRASVTCRDPDDQKFIDLAVAHKSLLISKDKAVLCMSKRLLALGAQAQAAIKKIA